MSKKILKIKEWRKTQKRLTDFVNTSDIVTGGEIRDWIADCIVHFTEIKMEPNIIAYFLSKLEYNEKKVEQKSPVVYNLMVDSDENEKNIGPFVFDYDTRKGYKIKSSNRLNLKTGGRVYMTPILVAFKVAENIINNYEEEERIIPKTLLNEFNTEKTQGIYLAMESTQSAYENKNTKSILASLITTTGLICELIPELVLIKDVGPKLKKIYETKLIYVKYNIDRETIWSLNNSRIIRNYDIHNPKKENNTTLYEAVGYCHLLVLFISSLLASGEIKL